MRLHFDFGCSSGATSPAWEIPLGARFASAKADAGTERYNPPKGAMGSSNNPSGEAGAGTGGLKSETISEEAVRAYVDKITSSRTFANATRSTRFLRFIADARLAGQTDRIQEYVLGLEVFDRKERFDPRIDSIVRVEGRRLRLRLDEYYRSEGQADRIRVELPKRGYVPNFRVCPVAQVRVRRLPSAAAVAAILGLGALTFMQRSDTRAQDTRPPEFQAGALAVLPFLNLSADQDHEYLADGLTDALITDLASLGSVRVISRTSIMRHKGSRGSARSIGRELGAGYLLEGAVSRSGNRLRVNVQLIEARTDSHIWAQSYFREFEDLFLLQSELVRQIAREIRVQLTPEMDKLLSEAPVVKAKALDAYLKGKFALAQRTGEAALRSARFFEEAIREEPEFALAHAWLAAAYRTATTMGNLPAREMLSKSTSEARRAVKLAPQSGAVRSSLAVSLAMQWDWANAEREFLTALRLSPTDSEAHHRYGILYLVPLGRLADAETELRIALELDRASLNNRVVLAKTLYFRRKYEDAASELVEVTKMDPGYSDALRNLGSVYVQQARYEDALAVYRKAQESAPLDWGEGLLAQALAASGQRRQASQILRKLISKQKTSSTAALAIATGYVGLGAHEDALAWLERARDEKDSRLLFIQADPIYDPLRSDSRFQKVATAAGLVRPAELE